MPRSNFSLIFMFTIGFFGNFNVYSRAQTSANPIQHIVIIVQENRTPDNLFQDPVLIKRGADIASSALTSTGQIVSLRKEALANDYDLGHSHTAFAAMCDLQSSQHCKMDGADLINVICNTGATDCPGRDLQFAYVNPADVQPYFSLAEQYTFGDRMFQTNQGPSFPAHQFIISGTSAPTATSTLFAAENPDAGPAGCIAPLTETVTMIDATGSETNSPPEYPCFDHPTLTDLLGAASISWRYYAPSPGSIWTGPAAIEHICQPQTINGT